MPQISKSQLAILFVNILIPTAHVQVLITTIKYAKQDAWIAVLIAYILAVILSLICLELIKRYPKDNLLSFSEKIVGKPLAKVICIILFLYSFLISAYMVEQFSTLMTTMVYRATPAYVFRIGIILLAVYIVNSGVEVLFRVSDFVFIGVLLVTIVIGGGLLKEFDLNNLLPIFSQDINSIVKASITPTAFFGQIILFLFFHNLVDDLKGITRTIHLGLLIGMLLVIGFVIADLAVFGADLGSLLTFPPFMIIRQISIQNIFDRVEILMLTLWIGLALIEIAAYFWISNQSIARLFNLNQQKIINLPLAVILVAFVTLSWRGIVDFQEYINISYIFTIFIIEFSIPIVLYLISLIRGKRGGSSD